MKKLWRIFAVVTALCMMLTTVAFAAEAADDATTAEEPAATDEAAEGEEEPAADDTEEPVNTVVQPDDNLYPVALDDYNGLSQIPFMTRLFTQNHINWTLVQLGEPVEGVFGQTVEANWDNTKFLIEWKDTDTNNFTQDPLLQAFFIDRTGHLHTLLRIAGHHIGAGDEDALIRAAAKAVDAGMFQITSDDAVHFHMFRIAGNARQQTTDAADDQTDLHTGAACLLQTVDDLAVRQRVQLHEDLSRLLVTGLFDFRIDHGEHLRLQRMRCHQQMLIGALQLADGHILEEVDRIDADALPGGQITVVGVLLTRLFIVVPGADLRKILQLVLLFAGDQAQLGMHLVILDAIEHRAAAVFQQFCI